MPVEGDYSGQTAVGNFGLADQRRALEFVHDHISGFGGDNSKVTLAGQSAGAESTYLQLMTEGPHQDWISQGMMMSIPSGLSLLPKEQALELIQPAVENATSELIRKDCDMACVSDVSQVSTAELKEIMHLASWAGNKYSAFRMSIFSVF